MNIQEYADQDMLAIDVANQIAGDLSSYLGHSETASLAVAGGTTPAPVFDDLCGADIDWSRVTVMATDERWVPPESGRSNARMIRERLLTNRAAAAQFLPFYREGSTPDDALAGVQAGIEAQLPVSVLLLGMGEDMHTASLFPGVNGLAEALSPAAPPLAVMRPSSQPEARVTLTANVLNGAIAKHLVIYGDAKREALERARTLPPEDAPVQAVLSGMTVHWAP